MILDKIENLHLYEGLNPRIKTVVNFLKKNDLRGKPQGRVDIKKGVYVNFDVAHGKKQEEAVLESHNRMMDIQILLDCEERMGWSPRSLMPSASYDEERDISFYQGCKPQQYILVRPGHFALFLPDDVHAPCICTEANYRKVIFKVKV